MNYFYTWNWIPFAEPILCGNKVILQAWKAIELKPFYSRKSISFMREKLIGILSGPITIFVKCCSCAEWSVFYTWNEAGAFPF